MPSVRVPGLPRWAPLLSALAVLAVTGLLPLAFTSDHLYPDGYFLKQFLLASGALALAGLAWLPRWPGAPWLALLGLLLAAGQVGEFLGWIDAAEYYGETRNFGLASPATWNPVALVAVCLGIVLQGAALLLDGRAKRA